MRFSTREEGGLGVQPANRFSSRFQSFIVLLLQPRFQLLHAIPIAPGNRIGRGSNQVSNPLKRVLMPNFQNNDFTLLPREPGQAGHRGTLDRIRACRGFEPTFRFNLPGQTPPEPTPEVQSPIAETAHAIMLRLGRFQFFLEERQEGFLQHVFRLAMRQPQSSAVQNELTSLFFIKALAPAFLEIASHCFCWIDTEPGGFRIRNSSLAPTRLRAVTLQEALQFASEVVRERAARKKRLL
jgi:hypothetical protein